MTTPTPEALPAPQFAAAWHAMAQAERILIVTHVKPDGDAIGALCGLALALRELGKTPLAVVDGSVPEYLRFIPGSDATVPRVTAGDFDVMISVDASDEERTGAPGVYGRAHSALVINIDHHPTNTAFGALHVIVPDAVSTTQILFDLLSIADRPISQAVAGALLAGMVTDTIGFRTNNVTPRTLEIAQALMRAGASLHEIMTRTLGTMSWRNVELWKYALQTVALEKGVISAAITREAIKLAHMSQPSDSGGFVGFLNSTEEARIAAVFKEVEDGKVEMSFRAKPGFDVATLALSLGGGGHRLAAGVTLSGTLEEVQARVLPLLQQAAADGAS